MHRWPRSRGPRRQSNPRRPCPRLVCPFFLLNLRQDGSLVGRLPHGYTCPDCRGVSKHLRPVALRKFSAHLSAKRVSIRKSQGAHDHENAFTRRTRSWAVKLLTLHLSVFEYLAAIRLLFIALTLLLTASANVREEDVGKIRVKKKVADTSTMIYYRLNPISNLQDSLLLRRHTLLRAYR